MNVTAGALETPWGISNKPASLVKGSEFGRYVKEIMFPPQDYELVHDSHENEKGTTDPALSAGLPDFLFRSKREGLEFFIETKYRSSFQDRILEWGKFFELKHYREIDTITPVIIAIGLGGRQEAPERVFLVPVKHVMFVKLYPALMHKYESGPGRRVSERFLLSIFE